MRSETICRLGTVFSSLAEEYRPLPGTLIMGKIKKNCCKAISECACIRSSELAYRGGRAACVGLTWWSRWALLQCTCIEKTHLVSCFLFWGFMGVSLFFFNRTVSSYSVVCCRLHCSCMLRTWHFLMIKILLLMGLQSRYYKSVLCLWLCSNSLNGL